MLSARVFVCLVYVGAVGNSKGPLWFGFSQPGPHAEPWSLRFAADIRASGNYSGRSRTGVSLTSCDYRQVTENRDNRDSAPWTRNSQRYCVCKIGKGNRDPFIWLYIFSQARPRGSLQTWVQLVSKIFHILQLCLTKRAWCNGTNGVVPEVQTPPISPGNLNRTLKAF